MMQGLNKCDDPLRNHGSTEVVRTSLTSRVASTMNASNFSTFSPTTVIGIIDHPFSQVCLEKDWLNVMFTRSRKRSRNAESIAFSNSQCHPMLMLTSAVV